MNNIARAIFGVAATVGLVLASFSVVSAADYGGGGVQGYAADTPISNGTIVQLTGEESNRVKVATQSEQQNMFGVAVDRNRVPLTVSGGNIENETFVAVSGTYNVRVSTQEGPIKKGDYVALSSVNGVAMQAGTEKATVFGRAQAAFDGKSNSLGTTTLNDVNGNQTETVSIGSIPVTIDIRSNPNDISTKTQLPEFLERIGQAIAEKEVSPLRMYLSLAITAISLIIALVVLYSGVRNSIISIGRNPMSKRMIFKALLQIVLTSLLILIVGLFAVYLLLKL